MDATRLSFLRRIAVLDVRLRHCATARGQVRRSALDSIFSRIVFGEPAFPSPDNAPTGVERGDRRGPPLHPS
jgi:hypothetical protein